MARKRRDITLSVEKIHRHPLIDFDEEEEKRDTHVEYVNPIVLVD